MSTITSTLKGGPYDGHQYHSEFIAPTVHAPAVNGGTEVYRIDKTRGADRYVNPVYIYSHSIPPDEEARSLSPEAVAAADITDDQRPLSPYVLGLIRYVAELQDRESTDADDVDEPWRTLVCAHDALQDVAKRLERLSPGQRRRLFRRTGLDADVIRNEAERCSDIFSVYGDWKWIADHPAQPHEWVEYTPGHRDTPIHRCSKPGCEATREIDPEWPDR